MVYLMNQSHIRLEDFYAGFQNENQIFFIFIILDMANGLLIFKFLQLIQPSLVKIDSPYLDFNIFWFALEN